MNATAPIEVGARGTVGSLLRKEIEYFRRLELDPCGSSIRPQRHSVDMSSTGGKSWPSFGFLMRIWRKRKRKRRGSGYLPRVCSAVEVAESYWLNGVQGFSYRNLKADMESYEI